MNKQRICLLISLLGLALFGQAELRLFPTFESCSVYLPHEGEGECRFYYRSSSDKDWQLTYPPIYDVVEKEFRGSIVRLKENTDYRIKAEVWRNGRKISEESAVATTWSSDVKIAQTIPLSRFRKGEGYVISGQVGTPNAWIRITSDSPVDLTTTRKEAAVELVDCRFVILEKIVLKGGWKHGILIGKSNSDIRILNCDISKWGRTTEISDFEGNYVDPSTGKPINWDAAVRIEEARNIVIERCYLHDPKGITNAWKHVVKVGEHKGKQIPWLHPKGMNGIFVRQAKQGIVIRYNDVIGSQTHRFNDPIESAENQGIDGGLNRDADVYGNVMAFGQDDGTELDGAQCNVRFFDNRIEQVYCGLSTAPNRRGPSYVFNNVIFNQGDEYGSQGALVKNGGGFALSSGRTFVFNNTMVGLRNGMTGVGAGSKNDPNRVMFTATTRNNIFLTQSPANEEKKTGSIADRVPSGVNDFDFDLLGNTAAFDGKGSIFAASGAEKNGVFGLPRFVDQNDGVFTLLPVSPAIDCGETLPNFTNAFSGSSPDIGALEFGTSSLIPKRPIAVEADKYHVRMTEGEQVTIRFKTGRIVRPMLMEVRKSEDMGWLSAELSERRLESDSSFTLTLRVDKSVQVDYRRLGVLIVRFDNGLSVPISVTVSE